jgi:hypothetical protein
MSYAVAVDNLNNQIIAIYGQAITVQVNEKTFIINGIVNRINQQVAFGGQYFTDTDFSIDFLKSEFGATEAGEGDNMTIDGETFRIIRIVDDHLGMVNVQVRQYAD